MSADATARTLLRESVAGRRRALVALGGWSAAEALPAFLSGLLVAHAVDDGFAAGRTGTGFAWLAALAVAVVVGAWATRQTWLRLASLVEPFRDRLVERAVRGALERSTRPGAPADAPAVARLSHQVEIVREAYASVLLTLQGFVVATTGALLGLLTLQPEILVLVVPPLALGLALFAAALPRMARTQRLSILAEERIAGQAMTVAGGLRDVTACGGEAAAAAAVGLPVEEHARATRDLAHLTAVRTLAVAVGGLVPVVLILAAGPWLMRHGASTGTILGALTYVAQGVHPALQTLVRGLAGPGLWLIVTLRRIAETGGETASTARAASVARPEHGVLRLSGVTFAYGAFAAPVVEDLDLTVPEGTHLAIVGPSGAGKSTLAGLMSGILRPQAGVVHLGGVPLERLDAAALAARRVLIPQEAYVFAGTLRENLTYLEPGAGDAAIGAAAERLGAAMLLERLGGLDAEVDPGALTDGERQVLTLVRAYLSPAPLVILDEASSHLDPVTETRVEQAFAARGGTTIVIAHRMSSALRADRVLVLDGAVATLGRHVELLGRSALYRDLAGHWDAGAVVARQQP